MLRPKIAVLVSGGGTNLQALLDARDKGILTGGDIALVVSSKEGVYAIERAKAAGVKALVVARKGKSGADFEAQLQDALQEHGIDLVVLAGFLCILSADFIARHEAALARGVKVTGATVHLVNEIPDGGKILLQRAVPVLDGDTPETLQRRVMEQAEWELLPRAVQQLCETLSCGQ